MRVSAALTVLPLAACGAYDSRPVQSPEQVAALFVAAIRGCTAGLTPEGKIDQTALAATGWRVTKRSTRYETESRDLPLDAFPKLRRMEYEATDWVRDGRPDELEVIRSAVQSNGLADHCGLNARTRDDTTAKAVIDMLSRWFGRAPDRQGEQPRGGDFLTPRFDKAEMSHYWAMPRNDVYVNVRDGGLGLDVLTMPDRAAVDHTSYDHPEHRIPTQERAQ